MNISIKNCFLLSCILLANNSLFAQNFKKAIALSNAATDSLGSYGIEVDTKVYRKADLIEKEVMQVSINGKYYQLSSKLFNTYCDDKYQLVEDKENKVYYLAKNDSAILQKGLTGKILDSAMLAVKHSYFSETDSVSIYTLVYDEDAIDSVKYYFNKNNHLLAKTETWMEDEEERITGEYIEDLKKEHVKLVILYQYKKYTGGKSITDIVTVNGENASLKQKNTDWELINMIPIQNQILKGVNKQ